MMTAKSKNKAKKLLPCPFCGGECSMIEVKPIHSGKKYHACCANEKCMLFVGGRWYETLEDAAEAWNRRCENND